MILVTGGRGFLGSHLVNHFISFGRDVRVFDIIGRNCNQAFRTDYVCGDICNEGSLNYACRGVDTVIHAAAAVPLSRDEEEIRRVNFDGTKAVYRACQRAGVRHLVFVSSSAVYGVPWSLPVKTVTRPHPQEAYGTSKFITEAFLLWQDINEMPKVSIVRPRTIIGPGRLGLFGKLFEWVRQGYPIPVWNKGENVYQFLDVRDCVRAISFIVKGDIGGRFNLGATSFYTIRDTLQSLIEHANSKSRIINVPYALSVKALKLSNRLGLTSFAPYHLLMYGKSFYFDRSAWDNLGIRPTYGNHTTMSDAYDWYCANREAIEASSGASAHRSIM